jgi:hypothetical protein
MSKAGWMSVSLIVGMSWSACVADQGAEDADDGLAAEDARELSSSEQALSWENTYIWRQGGTPRNMGSTDTRFCVLTRIQGRFRGAGEWVAISNVDGHWELDGRSQQIDVEAEATCFPRVIGTAKYGVSSAVEWRQGEPAKILGPLRDRACFLTGISGRFDSGDVSVNIEPSNIDGWRLNGRFPGSKSLWAKARCVTPPAGSIPGAFIGPAINWSQGKSSVQTTLSTRSFVCGLSSMRGNFNGKGEYLHAFRARNETNTDTVWWLGGGSQQTGVGGQMTCAGP